MNNILFVCTGNYYRSRFAEIYFNYLADVNEKKVSADSKGLEANQNRNVGPISKHTIAFLEEIEISFSHLYKYPEQMLEEDFSNYHEIIFMDEKEHRPMVEKYFPAYVDKVTYWSFEDVQFVNPEDMFPHLKNKIEVFFEEIK